MENAFDIHGATARLEAEFEKAVNASHKAGTCATGSDELTVARNKLDVARTEFAGALRGITNACLAARNLADSREWRTDLDGDLPSRTATVEVLLENDISNFRFVTTCTYDQVTTQFGNFVGEGSAAAFDDAMVIAWRYPQPQHMLDRVGQSAPENEV